MSGQCERNKMVMWVRAKVVKEKGQEETARGKREIKKYGDERWREREIYGEKEQRMDRKRLRERERELRKDGKEKGEGGGGSASTPRRFVFSLFPRGLLINYCD